MKNRFPFQKLILVIFLAAIVSCKKKEIIDLHQPVACFYAKQSYSDSRSRYPDFVTRLDSGLYFYNCSDTGDNVTYHWDFGDGTTSDERVPVHKYARRGSYKVTLEVSVQNIAYDTMQRTVYVVLGEKNISLGNGINAAPVAIEETAANEFILLSTTRNDGRHYLIQLDSLLNTKSMKTLPAGYRLNSMQPTTDGNYIFTGTTQGADKNNELVKLKADGTLVWNKILSTENSYTYAAQTSDGGYTAIGSRPVKVGPYNITKYITVIGKTDNNGNQQWQKQFDQELMQTTRDAVIEQNGIVIAGVKQYSGSCSSCDSLYIAKLDYAGNFVWKNTMVWGLNNYSWAGTHITKLTNGNYGVLNDTTKAIYHFTPSGNFVDRIVLPERVIGMANAADGNLLSLHHQSTLYLTVGKFTVDGYQKWLTMAQGRTNPVAIRPLRNGGVLAIGTRQLSDNGQNNNVILLWELDEAGKEK